MLFAVGPLSISASAVLAQRALHGDDGGHGGYGRAAHTTADASYAPRSSYSLCGVAGVTLARVSGDLGKLENHRERDLNNSIEIYQVGDGRAEVKVRFEQESVWLTQRQMSELFGTTSENVLMHLKNIYKDQELEEEATTKKFLVVQTEGKRQVERQLQHYNLDAIISVGYRVNSKQGVQFRIWASNTLREHLLQGYTLNQHRFEQNAEALRQALALIEKTVQSPELTAEAGSGLVEIVSRYTQTFLWLQQYDEGLLEEPEGQTGGALASPAQAMASLNQLKQQLMARGEATELFAQLREDGLASLLGNLEQSVFGEAAYPSVESKAAHLLYFVIKNHPFSDGNKRSGAFLFVDFLHRNGRLLNKRGEPVINDTGLAALTLLIAESDPKQKEVIIRLVMTMLAAPNQSHHNKDIES